MKEGEGMTPEELDEARALQERIDNEEMRGNDVLRLASDHWRLLKHVEELEEARRKDAADELTRMDQADELMELAEPLIRLNKALKELGHPPVALALHTEPGGFGGHYAVLELVRTSKNGAPAVVASLSMPLPVERYEEKG